MASQWIRWNQTTHIFEYSTDNGASFVPLPLSAATINEGNIPDAILSPNVVREDLANVFTSALPISIESANPIIQFKETDQPADSRFWRESIQGGAYRLQSLSDALGATDLLTVDRTGALVLSQNADYTFGGAVGASVTRLIIQNTVSGAARLAGLNFNTDIGFLGAIQALSSGYATSGWLIPNSLAITGSGAGGLNLAAGHASGIIRLFTAGSGTPKLTIDTTGNLTSVGTITERGRANAMGDWINVPYNASDYSTNSAATWVPDAGDLRTFRYMMVGKTMTIVFSFVTTTVAGTPAPAQLRFKIPGGYTVAYQTTAFAQIYDAASGAWQIGCVTANQGLNYLLLTKINLVTTFTVAADAIYAYGEITFEVN